MRTLLLLLALIPSLLFSQGRYPFHSSRATATTYEEDIWYLFENDNTDEVGSNDFINTDITFVTTPTPPEGTYAGRSVSSTTDFFQLPTAYTGSFPSDFTITFRIQVTTSSTAIVLVESGTLYTTGFGIRLNSSGNDLDVFTNATELNATNFTTDAIDVWFEFAVSYDGSTGDVNIIVNGVDKGGGTGVSGITLTNDWYILSDAIGYIDNFRLFPRVLSVAECLTLYGNPDDPL